MEILITKLKKPKDGILGLKENWKNDLVSGFMVFLIALPLSLGVAMASGFPPVGGIITAIIGGLVVTPLMGSQITIKGPAAGLIAIGLAAVIELGQGDPLAGYKYTLAVVVISGVVQIVFGAIKLGRFVDFFPTAAVHGMLAAIGIIIILKQIPVMLGVVPESESPIALFLEIPQMIANLNPEIALIGVLGLVVLFGLPLIKGNWAKKIPTPMLVLLIAMPMGRYFDLDHQHAYLFLDHHYFVGPKFLVTLPNNILDGITFPDFGKIVSLTSLKYVIMFALVGSLESLLTVKAIDGLDPFRRKANSNRDLLAVGAGNTLSGFIGGLPMIAEVVRSSANVSNGAKTRWSNFFHGLVMLVFVAFFPNLIHQIPLSALAAMLIFTGFKLASPKLFKDTLKIGKEQLFVFLITVIVTLAEDLLIGIMAGILVEIAVHIYNGVPIKLLFKSDFQKVETETEIFLKAKNAAIFTNFLGFKRQIDALPLGKNVIVDFQLAKLIDHTFMEQITHFKHDYEEAGGKVLLIGMEHLTPVSNHALSARKVIHH